MLIVLGIAGYLIVAVGLILAAKSYKIYRQNYALISAQPILDRGNFSKDSLIASKFIDENNNLTALGKEHFRYEVINDIFNESFLLFMIAFTWPVAISMLTIIYLASTLCEFLAKKLSGVSSYIDGVLHKQFSKRLNKTGILPEVNESKSDYRTIEYKEVK